MPETGSAADSRYLEDALFNSCQGEHGRPDISLSRSPGTLRLASPRCVSLELHLTCMGVSLSPHLKQRVPYLMSSSQAESPYRRQSRTHPHHEGALLSQHPPSPDGRI